MPGNEFRPMLSYALVTVMTALPALGNQDPATPPVPGGALRIIGEDGAVAGGCPLEHTDVNAQISGFVGRTTVRQIFHNPTDRKIEAVYVFPLPADGAVDSMVMTVGERRVVGRIKPRDEARVIYEAAREAGHVAGLLDQERPNIFTQSVANIEPGVEVVIEISYVETLRYEEGRFEWVFPMVVGPRYIPGGGSAPAPMTKGQDTEQAPDASKITPPVTPERTRAGHDISLSVSINGGTPEMAPFDIESELHEIDVTQARCPGCKIVRLMDQAEIPNRDFVLRYRMGSEEIGDSVLVHRDERGEFMTLILQPPQRVVPEHLVNRELVFVLDTSGSMSGFPIEKAKETMSKLIDTMREGDTFNLITFAGQTRILWAEPRPNTAENRAEAQALLAEQKGGGGTEMMRAIEVALKPSRGQARRRLAPSPAEDGAFHALTVPELAALPADGRRVRVLLEWTRYRHDEKADRVWLLLPDESRIAATAFQVVDPKVTCRVGETILLEGQWKTEGEERLLQVESARFANLIDEKPWITSVQLAHWVGDGSSVTLMAPSTDLEVVLQDGAAPAIVDLRVGDRRIRAHLTHWTLSAAFEQRAGEWLRIRGSLMKRGEEMLFQAGEVVWPVEAPKGVTALPNAKKCTVEEAAEILYAAPDPARPHERRFRETDAHGMPPQSELIEVAGTWVSKLPKGVRSSGGTSHHVLSDDGRSALAVASGAIAGESPAEGEAVRLFGRVAYTPVGSVLQPLQGAHPDGASPPPVRVVCFMTDGYVGNDMAIIDAVKKYADTARVFSFGIGNSVNRYLLDGIAHAGRGEAEYVTLASQAAAAVERFHERILAPVLTDITIEWGDLPITDVYPRRIPDLFAAQPIMVHGRIDRSADRSADGGGAANAGAAMAGTITLHGNTGAGAFERAIGIHAEQFSSQDAFAASNPALPSLWARAKVADLMNQDLAALQQGSFPEPLKSQITNLGVEFNLMTQFTSFVAVEEMTVTVGGEPVRIDVPVEMPSGVSYEGVFGKEAGLGRAGGFAAGAPIVMSEGGAKAATRARTPAARRGVAQSAPAAGAARAWADEEAGRARGPVDKLAEPLRGLAEKVAKEGSDGDLTVGRMKVVDYRVDVIVALSDTSEATLKALETLGFKQTGESKAARLLIGSIDVRKLAELAKLAAVTSVRPVMAP